jgi:hypothetical protein
MVYLPYFRPNATNLAALLASFLTAMSMAFLYGQDVDPAHEVILLTPTPSYLILSARCFLVFGYNLLLNCGLLLPIMLLQGTITPSWFLSNWLAPLCCLSAIALFLSILQRSSLAILICSMLWGLRILINGQWMPKIVLLPYYEGFWHQSFALFIIAILIVFWTFSILERKDRFAS